ncbi:NAD(P)-dependent dehydrogenase (short-subunit alcohol dehydrogenase family) [Alkalihalobacillus xiaoxiensis]|uniref:NAD(P)-dependent dehydrogenase (Short-subunit alcohol dehydrogenase family) n=1 Tax=Shouchella xiaoxiensis TaxID=766895 RepID=A0ABS2SNW3_9BACI|nr:NAD(P)-dependent dehydrogenase (short-subunit alcohol dehydrogenase family) [Shouchella xiaoxiensis]
MIELKNQVVIVTGGASGIGLATAKRFLEKGAKVVIGDFNEKAGEDVVQDLKGTYSDVTFVKVNVAEEASVKNLVAKTVETYGQLNVIFNNAGIGIQKPTHELTYEEYQKVIAVNQDGVFFGVKNAIPELLKAGGGSIINTASILGAVGEPTSTPYAASKGAVNLITKSVALEYADRNIRCNAVAPGFIESGLVNKEALGDFYDGLVAKHPAGRLGTPDEIAHGVVYLAENEFVTGTTIYIDGGYTAK